MLSSLNKQLLIRSYSEQYPDDLDATELQELEDMDTDFDPLDPNDNSQYEQDLFASTSDRISSIAFANDRIRAILDDKNLSKRQRLKKIRYHSVAMCHALSAIRQIAAAYYSTDNDDD